MSFKCGRTLAFTLAAFGACSFSNAALALNQVAPANRGAVIIGGVLAESAVWQRYQARFVSPEGRIIDTANAGISHSEGQGYGLLLAVAAGDRAAFNHILAWTNKNLFVRKDHLAAWRWKDGHVAEADQNNATDGDILIAWALAEAADYWNEPKYFNQAKLIAADVVSKLIDPATPAGVLLKPALEGFSANQHANGPVINLSYWVYPAFGRMRQLAPEANWSGLEATGLNLSDSAGFGNYRLPSDWSALGSGQPTPAEGFDDAFGYNAIRIPLYVYWAGNKTPNLMQSFARQSIISGQSPKVGSQENQFSPEQFSEQGYKNVEALAQCSFSGRPFPPNFYHFVSLQNYYPATLQAFSLIAAANIGGDCVNPDMMASALGEKWQSAGALPKDVSRFADEHSHLLSIIKPEKQLNLPVLNSETSASTSIEEDQATSELAAAEASKARVALFKSLILGFIAGVAALKLISVAFKRYNARKTTLDNAFTGQSNVVAGAEVYRRNLPTNPFFSTSSVEVLEGQIEAAAAASVEFNKTFGIIYFKVGASDGKMLQPINGDTSQAIEDLAEKLRSALRKTDHVAVIDHSEIVVCISLLPGYTELTSIGERLRKIGLESGLFEKDFAQKPGLAIYPLGGYRGGELIASARTQHSKLRLQLAG